MNNKNDAKVLLSSRLYIMVVMLFMVKSLDKNG